MVEEATLVPSLSEVDVIKRKGSFIHSCSCHRLSGLDRQTDGRINGKYTNRNNSIRVSGVRYRQLRES